MFNEVRLLGADLAVGETVRALCPVCQGGSSSERTLTITRDDEGLVYNCYRATCPAKGRAGGRSLVTSKSAPPKLHPYTGALHDLPPEWATYLSEEIGFDEDHIARAKPRLTDEGRVAYPILSPLGRRRGWVLRGYRGEVPKALTRMDVEEPHTSYYTASRWERGLVCWLVEDIPSAVRMSRYVDSAALCGNGLSQEGLVELTSQYRNVVWALDADATSEALKQSKRWSIYFDTSTVQVLEKDPKDSTEEELQCLVKASLV